MFCKSMVTIKQKSIIKLTKITGNQSTLLEKTINHKVTLSEEKERNYNKTRRQALKYQLYELTYQQLPSV